MSKSMVLILFISELPNKMEICGLDCFIPKITHRCYKLWLSLTHFNSYFCRIQAKSSKAT